MKSSDEITVRAIRLTPSGPRAWSPSMATNKTLRGVPANPSFQPTQAAPGSEVKIQVLEQRRAAGLPLFHPDDRIDREGMCSGQFPSRWGTGIGTGRVVGSGVAGTDRVEKIDAVGTGELDQGDLAELDEFHEEFHDEFDDEFDDE